MKKIIRKLIYNWIFKMTDEEVRIMDKFNKKGLSVNVCTQALIIPHIQTIEFFDGVMSDLLRGYIDPLTAKLVKDLGMADVFYYRVWRDHFGNIVKTTKII